MQDVHEASGTTKGGLFHRPGFWIITSLFFYFAGFGPLCALGQTSEPVYHFVNVLYYPVFRSLHLLPPDLEWTIVRACLKPWYDAAGEHWVDP